MNLASTVTVMTPWRSLHYLLVQVDRQEIRKRIINAMEALGECALQSIIDVMERSDLGVSTYARTTLTRMGWVSPAEKKERRQRYLDEMIAKGESAVLPLIDEFRRTIASDVAVALSNHR